MGHGNEQCTYVTLVCGSTIQTLVSVSSMLDLHLSAGCANDGDRKAAGMLLGSEVGACPEEIFLKLFIECPLCYRRYASHHLFLPPSSDVSKPGSQEQSRRQ